MSNADTSISSPTKKASNSTPRSTPAKRGRPAGKKAQAEMNGGGEESGDDREATPAKKTKTKKMNGVVKAEESEEELELV